MAKYNVHGGHNRKVPGASGILDEVTEGSNRRPESKKCGY